MTILDLYQSLGHQAKHVASTHGGEYAGPCPVCGGKDRFRIWPEQGDYGTSWCRGEDKSWDGIQFLRDFFGLGYREACERLGKDPGQYKPRQLAEPSGRVPRSRNFKSLDDPGDSWRLNAEKLVVRAQDNLLRNQQQLDYLAGRGINLKTVKLFRLGWLPGEGRSKAHFRSRKAWGLPPKPKGKADCLWIPRGLVIPNYRGDQIVGVRIRRPAEDLRPAEGDRSADSKYIALPPGGPTTVYNPTAKAFVVVEAALCGLAVMDVAGDLVGAVALGSDTAKPDDQAHELLKKSTVLLNAIDFDVAGGKAVEWWADVYSNNKRWPVPEGKDVGDAVGLGVDVRAWVIAGLPPSMTLGHSDSGQLFEEEGAVPVVAQGVAQVKRERSVCGEMPKPVQELVEILRSCPIRILRPVEGGVSVIESQVWGQKTGSWEICCRVSDLVFKSGPAADAVWGVQSGLEIHGGNARKLLGDACHV